MKTIIPVIPENGEPVPSKACSPLRPFKTRLRLLQFLGWPLKIANDEATEVKKRPWSIMFLILHILALVSLSVLLMVVATSSRSIPELKELMEQENIKKWEQKSLEILTAPNMLFGPIMFYYFYTGMDHKMTAFLKKYADVAETLQGKISNIITHGSIHLGKHFISDNTNSIFKGVYRKIIIMYSMDVLGAVLFASHIFLLHFYKSVSYEDVVAFSAVILIDLVLYFPFIASSG